MNNEKWLFERYRQALREITIAQNHFECCESDYIDRAIDDLVYAEKAFDRIIKEMRRENLDTSISKI